MPPTILTSAPFAAELIVVGRLLGDGIAAVSRGDDLSVRTGLLLTDLAVEMSLKVILRRYQTRLKDGPHSKFPVILEKVLEAAEAAGVRASHAGPPLSALRNSRNSVMHDGTGQDALVARDLVTRASNALRRLTGDVLGVDPLNVRAHEFLREGPVKTLLEAAAGHLERQEFWQAAAVSREAFRASMAEWTAFVREAFVLPKTALADPVAVSLSAGVDLAGLHRLNTAFPRARAFVAASGEVTMEAWGTYEEMPEHDRLAAARGTFEFASAVALQLQLKMRP